MANNDNVTELDEAFPRGAVSEVSSTYLNEAQGVTLRTKVKRESIIFAGVCSLHFSNFFTTQVCNL